MVWWRMMRVAVRLAWPYLLTPWRSPLLRWRLETFGLLDEQGRPLAASAITAAHVLRFLVTQPRTVLRFLRWAAELS